MNSRKKPIQQGRRPTIGANQRIYSRENVTRYSERARQRRRGKRIRRGILVTVLALLASVGTAFGVLYVKPMLDSFDKMHDSSVLDGLSTVLLDSDVARDPFYMLLLGTDGRPGETAYRSDSIILARIDPSQKKVALISIPRDTKVDYNGEPTKINAIHAYEGAKGMVEAVNKLCGVEISHYAEVNFNGMKKLIDAVGGIDINVPEGDEVDDSAAGPVKIEAGQQHMDGEAALTFSRARHQFADGDYTRMRHQRMVLGALANKVLNNLDVATIPDIIKQLGDMLILDPTLGVTDIVSLVNAMRGMDTDDMYSANVPSWAGEDTYINGQSFVFVYEDQLKEMMERVDAGEDPKGPQTAGQTGSGGSTVGDLYDNSVNDWAYGTAKTTGSGSDEGSDSSDSSSTGASDSAE